MSHWTYKGESFTEVPKTAFGFVYRITNTETGQMYLGRKYFQQTRRLPPLKGKKNKRVVRSESTWRTYTGSNDKLNADIKRIGKDKFKFEILILGETQGQVNMAEEMLQHRFLVLLDSNYYNDSIGARKFISVKITDEFRRRMLEI